MNNDSIEQALIAWGTWRAAEGLAQGWGGAGNTLEHPGWAPPMPGVHSDPVLAEYVRSLKQRHGDSALIDRLLTSFSDRDRKVMFLRYVGEKVAKTTKTLLSVESVEIGGGAEICGRHTKSVQVRMRMQTEIPLHWDYSGKLGYARVAELAGISEDAAARTVSRVRKDLRFQLMMMRRVRKGLAGEVRRAA